jgi:hypothetical protein
MSHRRGSMLGTRRAARPARGARHFPRGVTQPELPAMRLAASFDRVVGAQQYRGRHLGNAGLPYHESGVMSPRAHLSRRSADQCQ